jgi:branched-chain amino acid transport system permease protein
VISEYATITGINILLAWSVYVILLSGTLSFANGAFMAIGGYVAGIFTVKFGLPLAAGLVGAALAAAAVGLVAGYPALRTRGIYLMLVTVGLAFIVDTGVQNIAYIGGVKGMGGMLGTTVWHIYGAVLVVGAALWKLTRSPLQRLLDGVREDESVAGALGVNVVYLRLALFCIGAALAAFAGGLYSHHMFFIAPDHFTVIVSVFVVLYVIMGGVNNMWGPLLGATVLTLLPELFRVVGEWRQTVYGVAIAALLLVRREGLMPFRMRSVTRGRAR